MTHACSTVNDRSDMFLVWRVHGKLLLLLVFGMVKAGKVLN